MQNDANCCDVYFYSDIEVGWVGHGGVAEDVVGVVVDPSEIEVHFSFKAPHFLSPHRVMSATEAWKLRAATT